MRDELILAGITAVILGIAGAAIAGVSSCRNAHQCEEACKPYRSHVIEGECHCQSEAGWVKEEEGTAEL